MNFGSKGRAAVLKTLLRASAIALIAVGIDANADTVVPAQGQSQEQVNKDAADCQATAKTTYSDVQQEYRQEQAKDAAVAGAVVGGAKQRQSRRQQDKAQEQQAQQQSATAAQSAEAASKQAYSGCMSGKGYAVTP
jgi:hypothetical protein